MLVTCHELLQDPVLLRTTLAAALLVQIVWDSLQTVPVMSSVIWLMTAAVISAPHVL